MMKLVMVGGHTRNIGKTSVVEGVIRATSELNWTAVKITQYGHGVCSKDGQECDCAVTEHEFAISLERGEEPGTDTARFLAAGARRSLWVRTRQGELFAALPSLRRQIENDEFVIVESNSLRRFLAPCLYLQVIDPGDTDFKASAREFFDLADAYLVACRPGAADDDLMALASQNTLLARELRRGKPTFLVSAAERFMNGAVVDFVKRRLEVGEVFR